MRKKLQKKLLIVSLLLLLLLPTVFAEVVVFEYYNTQMDYKNGKLYVSKDLRLKNVGSSPIIPGEIHFKISKDEKGEPVAPVIGNFKVVNKFDKELETKQYSSDDEVDLVFTVWDPLLPNFFYDMTMTYELEYAPNGVLFYQIMLPEERTTIPVRSTETVFHLPKKYHVTYLSPDGEVSSETDTTAVAWDIKEAYQVEYSVVPFPRTGIRAVNLFWILIIVLFLLNLILRLRKKSRMARSV